MPQSKNKRKNKKKSNKKKSDSSTVTRSTLPGTSNTNTLELKDKLQSVYNDTISLATTCCHSCACCKVAMPQLNYCEFTQLIHDIWDRESRTGKIDVICKSLEYYMKNEFEKWGMETMIKPCMLLDEDGMCKYYDSRPLSCRLYGQWPEDAYNARVDKFEEQYKGLLTRDQLPLNKQCPFVERVDKDNELTIEIIDDLFAQLKNIDSQMGEFSEAQIDNAENYRAFHDWLLLKIFGEDWLVEISRFVMSADKGTMQDQIEALKDALRQQLSRDLPSID
jgi:Fe-S-cluster containining protein